MNIKTSSFKNIYTFLIILFCFVLPISPVLTSPVTMLFALVWLFECFYKNNFNLIKTEKFRLWLIIPVIFYLFHIISLFYSKNMSHAFGDLKIKLPFLLLPLFFSTISNECFSKKNIIKYFSAFIIGCIIFFLYNFYLSYITYYNNITTSTDIFFYSDLTRRLHPGYAALFSSMGVGLAGYLITQCKRKYSILYALAILILTIQTILFSSKSGYISLILGLLFGFYFIICSLNKTKIIITSISFIIILGLFGWSLKNISFINARLSDVTPALKGTSNKNSSSAVRIQLWQSSLKIIPQHFWFGVGSGDIRDDLKKEILEIDPNAKYAQYNPHNQFLQTFLALGLFGFIALFAFIIFTPIFLGIKNNYLLLVLLALMGFVNCFVESMMERQAGVMFFTFFYCLLIMRSFQQSKSIAPAIADQYEV